MLLGTCGVVHAWVVHANDSFFRSQTRGQSQPDRDAQAFSACAGGGGSGSGGAPPAIPNGYSLVAQSLARLGVKLMYGVIGIPVTELASAAQV